jgi:plastocyanin
MSKGTIRQRAVAAGVGMCAAIVAVACGNGPPQGSQTASGPPVGSVVRNMPADTTVKAEDSLVFSPASASVKLGGILEFENTGSVFHNVTFPDHSDITTSNFPGGATWEIKFTKAGTYPFVCTIHSTTMKGTVTVS